MTENLLSLLSKMELRNYSDPAQKTQIFELSKLPPDYIDFMSSYDGAVGFIGANHYIDLWRVENIIRLNPYFPNERFSKQVIVIGTDGSGTLYGYNIRQKHFFETDEYGMNEKTTQKCGDTFIEFINYLSIN